jgi:hypothetical protein
MEEFSVISKNRGIYNALFIAAPDSDYRLDEYGWDIEVKEYLCKKVVIHFIDKVLNLKLVNVANGIEKYIGEGLECSVIYSEIKTNKIESVYIQCYGSLTSVKQLFYGNELSRTAEMFDPNKSNGAISKGVE